MPPPEEETEAQRAQRAEAQRMIEEIKKRIGPQLEEMGIEGFVLAGYISTGDGKRSRIILGNDGGDPSIKDGLTPVNTAILIWADVLKPWRPDGG